LSELEFIAELACIHEGKKDYLLKLAEDFHRAGATAVKFQVFDPDELVSPDHPDYQIFKSIAFDETAWQEIFSACGDMGLAVWMDALGEFSLKVARNAGADLAAVKIHSTDVGNPAVFKGVRSLDVPIAIGCGGTSLVDLFEILDVLGDDQPVILMHGFQSFPKDDEAKGGPPLKPQTITELDLWRIRQLAETFPKARIGISEHLAGADPMAVQIPSLAVALGATVIEKHAALSRDDMREDYFSSLTPDEFSQMRDLSVAAQDAIGADRQIFGEGEAGYQREMKRTARAASPLSAGSVVSEKDFSLSRDGSYSGSLRATRAIGATLSKSVPQGEALNATDLELSVGLFCNSRLASSRLPGKALLPFLDDLTTLGYLLKRLTSYSGDIGQVVLATTTMLEDDQLEAVAKQIGVPCSRGPSADVMGRMVQTANEFGWDILVRVTGDDQFVSCEYIEKALAHHRANSLDYTRINGLPIGMACEVIDVATLRRIHAAIADKDVTEYVTWFLDSEWVCRNAVIEADAKHRHEDFRLTLDYQEDYETMREVAARCHHNRSEFYVPTEEIISTLEEMNPKWHQQEDLTKLERSDINTSLLYTASPASN
jgi:spore coat polysaccharide biosynthesis protein SpsF (cytidylyltransferase family)/sialic acid synthase SpsE